MEEPNLEWGMERRLVNGIELNITNVESEKTLATVVLDADPGCKVTDDKGSIVCQLNLGQMQGGSVGLNLRVRFETGSKLGVKLRPSVRDEQATELMEESGDRHQGGRS